MPEGSCAVSYTHLDVYKRQYKISEIAEKVGYHDISYFIRVFKKKYGVTPNNYGKY